MDWPRTLDLTQQCLIEPGLREDRLRLNAFDPENFHAFQFCQSAQTFSDNFQVAGWTQVYGDILSFATVRGAAHEAPFSQPERSLVLLKAFLEGKPLPQPFFQIYE